MDHAFWQICLVLRMISLRWIPSCPPAYTALTRWLESMHLRIIVVSPSMGYVERLHKVFKNTRTKLRDGLGYARALSLAFTKCEDGWGNVGIQTYSRALGLAKKIQSGCILLFKHDSCRTFHTSFNRTRRYSTKCILVWSKFYRLSQFV